MSEIVYYIVIILAFVGLYLYLKISSDKDSHYKELAHFYGMHDSNIEDIRKFFQVNPEKIKEAEELLKEKKESIRLFQESEKRELIKNRVYAYDYEEMLYQIYAPFAILSMGKWLSLEGLDKEYIVQSIAKIRNMSYEEAQILFEDLNKHNLINDFAKTGKFVLCSMLAASGSQDKKWQIVSDTDMNLDKWMVQHGYKHKTDLL